jgi:hypothetical protein
MEHIKTHINVHGTILNKHMDNIFTETPPDFVNKICLYRRKFNIHFSVQSFKQ